ncbi:MAG: hypothetical protein JWN86_3228 [Planctomycetota bacterium]|nr:hypothetical protein [Planctomycetota bacterium]
MGVATSGSQRVTSGVLGGVFPQALVGIRVWRVARERLGPDRRVLGQVRPHRLRAVVDVPLVPEDCQRHRQLMPQLPQERDGVLAADVPSP